MPLTGNKRLPMIAAVVCALVAIVLIGKLHGQPSGEAQPSEMPRVTASKTISSIGATATTPSNLLSSTGSPSDPVTPIRRVTTVPSTIHATSVVQKTPAIGMDSLIITASCVEVDGKNLVIGVRLRNDSKVSISIESVMPRRPQMLMQVVALKNSDCARRALERHAVSLQPGGSAWYSTVLVAESSCLVGVTYVLEVLTRTRQQAQLFVFEPFGSGISGKVFSEGCTG